jgi:hypothetical protein
MKYTCDLRKRARTRRGRRIDRGPYMQRFADRLVRDVSPRFRHAVVRGKFDSSEEACYIKVQQVELRRNTKRYTSLDGPGRGLHSMCIFPTMREAYKRRFESRSTNRCERRPRADNSERMFRRMEVENTTSAGIEN